ncbi:hypothetical protein KBY66_12165, partial [Synechococcus sp. Tobar12-5m-g]|uniref:hypothetical protein n=1 Tax=Synechococcus sp. Tobar12-5m-g TaxID=2823742 RepID=UPI0020CE58DA
PIHRHPQGWLFCWPPLQVVASSDSRGQLSSSWPGFALLAWWADSSLICAKRQLGTIKKICKIQQDPQVDMLQPNVSYLGPR